MSRRLPELLRLVDTAGPGRPHADPFEILLGRGTALLSTWASGADALRPLTEAAVLRPCDPRPLNALALAVLHSVGARNGPQAFDLLRKACAVSPSYVPAALNLVTLLESAGRSDLVAPFRDSLEARLAAGPASMDLEGPVLPLGYSRRGVAVSEALHQAVLDRSPPRCLDAWVADQPWATETSGA